MAFQPIAVTAALLCAAVFVSPVSAQRHGGSGFAPAGRTGTSFSRNGAVGRPFGRMHGGRRGSPGYGFLPNYYPYYYSDYDYEGRSVEPPPAPVFTETPEPPPAVDTLKPAESVVMELRGDHWVRLTSSGPVQIQTLGTTSTAFERPQPTSELPPAVLVFRDGHQEEAAKYTIVGTMIFIKADYWTSGSWSRKVPIADLDLSATLKLNQERGAKFSLPSRPSEVIFRP